MSNHKEVYKSLPGVDTLLASPELLPLLSTHGKELVTYCIRITLDHFRKQIPQRSDPPGRDDILEMISGMVCLHSGRHLRKVYNATGVIIHTNLGRAPFSTQMLSESFEVLRGYSNLEFDLVSGSRGSRNDHVRNILQYLTAAEDILIVNNAAAAVMLTLRTFAKEREVLVSRGELIEIGGSFRIPEIMAASDCIMVEVGTTNKTRISDYENRIGENTALLFKAHKSNYIIKGFTEEVSPADLVKLGRKHNLPVFYDLGSGLLRKIPHPALDSEPDVKEALSSGADLVCFSGDKLLGGPQAGIIAGKKQYIQQLRQEPMLRALRVCKTTLILLETACRYYLRDEELMQKNIIFRSLGKPKETIRQAAETLSSLLHQHGLRAEIIPSQGQCGGGALPDKGIESYAVILRHGKSNKINAAYAEKLYLQLLAKEPPVLGILKQGNLLFDMLTIEPEDIPMIADLIAAAHLTPNPLSSPHPLTHTPQGEGRENQ